MENVNKQLLDVAEKLKKAGATVPAPSADGTIESAMRHGLCIALVVVEEAIAAAEQAQQSKTVTLEQLMANLKAGEGGDAISAAMDQACTDMELGRRMREQAQQADPVAWQFYQDGKWWNGYDRIKNYRKNTEDAGIPTRDLYAQPPAVDVPSAVIGGIHLDMMCAGLHSDKAMADELWRVLQRHLAVDQPAVAVAVPDGYALVPIEPTPEMVAAGAESDSQFYDHARFVYRAMLAAAPQGVDSSVQVADEKECLHHFVMFRNECMKCGQPYDAAQKGGA